MKAGRRATRERGQDARGILCADRVPQIRSVAPGLVAPALVALLVICSPAAAAAPLLPPRNVQVFDTPNDGGGSLSVTWAPSRAEGPDLRYEITVEPEPVEARTSEPDAKAGPILVASLPSTEGLVREAGFPWWARPAPATFHYVQIKSGPSLTLMNDQPYTVHVAAIRESERAEVSLSGVVPRPNWINWTQVNNLLLAVLFTVSLLGCISLARRAQAEHREIFLRRIPGLDAVDEAIGRATELGKPILYLTGGQGMQTPSTIAAAVILGRVAKRVAAYETELIVPHRDPIVMAVCQEITKQAYLEAGKPDAYMESSNFFITDDQFSYTAAVDGIMLRQKPAANFFMGYYYAESLLLTETGASTGAIQIAGTDADHQLPFFVTTCDYTLIGEELYAASAYLSREPLQVGTLRAQDLGKAVILAAVLLGSALATAGAVYELHWPAYVLDLFRDLK